jgi:hypothetical protein
MGTLFVTNWDPGHMILAFSQQGYGSKVQTRRTPKVLSNTELRLRKPKVVDPPSKEGVLSRILGSAWS